MNNKEFFQKYKDILKTQANDGLEILKKLKVDDDNYQKIVVNINNANNIATQLDKEIEAIEKEEENKEENKAKEPTNVGE